MILFSTESYSEYKWKITSGNVTQQDVRSRFKFDIGEIAIFSADFSHPDFLGKTVSAGFKVNLWFNFPLEIAYYLLVFSSP